ncbi:pilus assembly protein TadG-related protein [Kribbella sp. NPDC051586]|uniref:pilus assembly protein TadG-related protein n=1 Tax=Kribbella sp. NPDC051586 TaxID=3364118 RepID=UPI00379E653F
MTHSERGSATLHTLLAAVLLLTAVAAATIWSSISTARHRLTAAADLTALSAAQSLATTQADTSPTNPTNSPLATEPARTAEVAQTTDSGRTSEVSLTTQQIPAKGPPSADQPPPVTPPATPCEVAARAAILNKVRLANCDVTSNAVTVVVSLELNLPVAHPTLTATSRAGPL